MTVVMRGMRVVVLGAALLTAAVAVAAGQTPASPSPAAQPTPPATAGQTPSPAPGAQATDTQGFTYNPEGRRDPFVSLLRRGGTAAGPGARAAGLAGLGAGEVTLRGTIKGETGYLAILQGADNRTYIVRAGDKLFDGTIRSITQNDVVILQQVNDPLSLEKQREVRKMLRQTEAN